LDTRDAAFLHLPGFFSPPLSEVSISAFAEAFDAVAENLGAREPVIVGASVGALVALAMETAGSRILVEPFFSTRDLWPLHELLANSLVGPVGEWARAILGFAPEGVMARDYSYLAARARGAFVLVGDEPLLPPRPLSALPSFTAAIDVELLRRNGAEVATVQGGHFPSSEMRAALNAVVSAQSRVATKR